MLSSSSRLLTRRAVVCRLSGSSGRPTTTAVANNIARRTMAEMPVPRSANAKLFAGHPKNEGWESTVYFYYGLSTLLIVGVLGFAPETDITTWAKQEAAARLRLKEAGIVEEFEFGKHYWDMTDAQAKESWDKFAAKSMIMSEDDDDEDEDEEEDDDEENGDDEDDDDDDDEDDD